MTESPWVPWRIPGGPLPEMPPEPGLKQFAIEVSWGSIWVNLNDTIDYWVGAETLAATQIQWRKVMATSPIAEGQFVVHAVKDNVDEQIQVYCYGYDQNKLNENVTRIEKLFSQLDYRVRVSLDSYREYWRCQPAEWTLNRSHTMTHNTMAVYTLVVPRFPTVTRELIV